MEEGRWDELGKEEKGRWEVGGGNWEGIFVHYSLPIIMLMHNTYHLDRSRKSPYGIEVESPLMVHP
jgi:hypothetical protein